MEDRRPVSLGDRLDLVALVCGTATAFVLATNLVFALFTDIPGGAAPSPVRQRLIQAARPAELTLAVVVLVGAAALAVGRWFDGDHVATPDGLGRLVVLTAGAVAALAVIGMFADVLWRYEGAVWGWRVAVVGERTGAAGLAGLACWLALPPVRRDDREDG